MENNDVTDEVLVAETLADKEVFSNLIERYEGKLRRYLRRITNVNDADIDDLLQEAFIKAYQNLNSFDASFPFSSWMYRIARNTAISEYRKRVVRPEALVLDDEQVVLHLADETNIEHGAHIQEMSVQLGEAITHLRDEYRDAIVLRFFEQKSYDEMSDIMMKPAGTIATLLNRAKKELRMRLEKQDNFEV